MSTNDQLGERTGTLAERPDANSQRAGSFWTTLPDKTLWQVIRDPVTGAQTWEPIAGPGAGGNESWPKYVVAPLAGPAAPYQSIQAAVDAAVADGHGMASPTTVLIFPGTYSETVALAAGVNLVGWSGRNAGSVIVQQSMTAAFSTANDAVDVENITVNVGCSLGGATTNTWRFRNCRFQGLLANGLEVTNTNSSALELRDCQLFASNPPDVPLSAVPTTTIEARNCTFGADPAAPAVEIGGATELNLRFCEVLGGFDLAGTSRVQAYDSLLVAESQALATMVAGTAFSILAGSHVEADTNPVFSGAGGAVVFEDPGLGNQLSASAAINLAAGGVARGYICEDFSSSAPSIGAQTSTVFFSALGAPATCPLPDSTDTYDGREIAIAKDASAQTVTVTASGGDTISFGAVVLGAGSPAGVILRLRRGTAPPRWDVVSIY